MTALSLNLSPVVHCSAKHHLQLTSQCGIQFSNLKDRYGVIGEQQLPDVLASREIWIEKINQLPFSFKLFLDGEEFVGAAGAAEVLESLGQILRDAEVAIRLTFYASVS